LLRWKGILTINRELQTTSILMNQIIQKLIEALGKEAVMTHSEASERVASNWRQTANLSCLALIRPKNTEEVAIALKICNEANQPIVPHGGLTNVVGGVLTKPDEIALSLERMNVIEEINIQNKTATVQAGVVLEHLQKTVAEKNLLFPLDLGARGSCMIGGNISTNAGGIQALRYGVMRNLVLGLEVVLADGTIVSSMNKMLKNNAGYDLKQLFIGSEGTLGIITKAVLRLEDAPKSRNTAFVALESFEKVSQFLQFSKRFLNNQLSTFEIIWNDYYCLMTSTPSQFKPPLPQKYPFYVLLESLGQDVENDHLVFQNMLEKCLDEGLILDAAIAQSEQEFSWFWGIREQVEFIFSIYSHVFLFDISLAISDMNEYIEQIKNDLKAVWQDVAFYAYGHIGDGNLHLFVSCGQDDEATRHRVEEIVFVPLQKIGGSITAEHGVGLEKKQWLHLSRTPEEIALMKTIKQALDPKGILNQRKIF
jgi:FAD/FMN-containing dehydrogenase